MTSLNTNTLLTVSLSLSHQHAHVFSSSFTTGIGGSETHPFIILNK